MAVKDTARRQFILDTTKMACGMSVLGLGLGLVNKQAKALPAGAIRPPGAGNETDFQSACIRCGLCVRDCPYDILQLATPAQQVATGTPFLRHSWAPTTPCSSRSGTTAGPVGRP